MKRISTLSKLFAVASLIVGSIWIGSYLTRSLLAYQLFEGTELVLKTYINDSNIDGILYTLLPAILVHFISFIVMIICIALFYLTSKLSLKLNGWLFIILFIVIFTLPFEIYLMLIDYKIISSLITGSFNSSQIITLLRDRIKELSSFPIVELLSYISFSYFIVFKPFNKDNES